MRGHGTDADMVQSDEDDEGQEAAEDELEEPEEEGEEESEEAASTHQKLRSMSRKSSVAKGKLGIISSKRGETDSDEENLRSEEARKNLDEDEDETSEEDSGEEDDFDEENPETQLRNWKSNLIKSG